MNFGGLKIDSTPIHHKTGDWVRARNITMKNGVLSNEDGFDILVKKINGNDADRFNAPFRGAIAISDGRIVLFFGSPGNTSFGSEIGILEIDGTYNTILTGYNTVLGGINRTFGFAVAIEGVHKILSNGDLVVAWWDGILDASTNPYILNLTNLPFALGTNLGIAQPEKIQLMKMFPNMSYPTFQLVEVLDSGGNIPSGIYYFTVAYEISIENITNYISISNPTPVVTTADTQIAYPSNVRISGYSSMNYNVEQGDGILTNKSIRIRINDLDINFPYFKLIVIRKIAGVISVKEVGRYQITGSTFETVYIGQDSGEELSVDEVLIQDINFEKIKTGTVANDELVIGNTKTKTPINYQRFANNLGIDYITELPTNEIGYVDVGSPEDNTFYLKGVCPDEVMALYIGFIRKDGSLTEEFHIPGRRVQPVPNIPGASGVVLLTNGLIPFGTTPFPVIFEPATSANGGLNTQLVFRRVFFNNFELINIYNTYFNNPTVLLVDYFDATGTVPYDHPVISISYALIGGIQEYTFILATPFASFPILPNRNCEISRTSSPLLENDLLSDFVGISTADEIAINPRAKWFHTRDTSNNPNALFADGISIPFTYPYFGTRMGYWENDNEVYPDTDDFDVWGYDANAPSVRDSNLSILDPSDPSYVPTLRNAKVRHHKFPSLRGVKNVGQSPRVTIGIKILNMHLAANLEDVQGYYISYATREGVENRTILGYSPLMTSYPVPFGAAHAFTRAYEFTLLQQKPTINPTFLKKAWLLDYPGVTNLIRDNIIDFLPARNVQTIVSTEYQPDDNGSVIPSNDKRPECIVFKHNPVGGISADSYLGLSDSSTGTRDNKICIGAICNFMSDVFTPFYRQKTALTSKILRLPTDGTINYDPPDEIYGFDTFCCPHNVLLPNTETAPAVNTDYFSYLTFTNSNLNYRQKNRPSWNHQTTTNAVPYNYNQYDQTFSSVVNIKNSFPFDPFVNRNINFPYRISRSNVISSESLIVGWRRFKANKYYDMPNNKGVIWKIAEYRKGICINMENTMYLAQIKDKLAVNISEVYLGAGDIFDRQPDDVLPVPEGYAGCKSQFATTITPHGYCFIDKEAGKVFLFNGNLTELTDKDCKFFFEQNLDTNGTTEAEDVFPVYGDDPFTGSGLVLGYDKKYDRLIVSKRMFFRSIVKDRARLDVLTMSYSFADKEWICKHDYQPCYLFSDKKGLIALTNILPNVPDEDNDLNSIYRFNSLDKVGRFTLEVDAALPQGQRIRKSFVDIIFRSEPSISQSFDVINWISEVRDIAEKYNYYDKTITHIMVYNDRMCTGVIPITSGFWLGSTAKNVYESWAFNRIRDVLINPKTALFDDKDEVIDGTLYTSATATWLSKNKYLHKFVIVRFIYDNAENFHFALNDSGVVTTSINR